VLYGKKEKDSEKERESEKERGTDKLVELCNGHVSCLSTVYT